MAVKTKTCNVLDENNYKRFANKFYNKCVSVTLSLLTGTGIVNKGQIIKLKKNHFYRFYKIYNCRRLKLLEKKNLTERFSLYIVIL